MPMITRLTLATVALLGSVALAGAQTAQDHNAHHPDTPAPKPSPGGAKRAMPMMDMGEMTGGDMGRMMSMARMIRMMQGDDGMSMMPFDHIEGRIAFYKAELAITDAQLPQWNAFADALRNSAKGMQMAMATAMQGGMPASAPARADAMVQMMSARLDAMKATAVASKALYAVLTEAQKKTVDELMAEHMMGMRAMGMGVR